MMVRFECLITMFVVLTLGIAGCGGPEAAPPSSDVKAEQHAHSAKGPHGGSLVELGNEEYHAEVVHNDQAGTVTVYVLDSSAKSSVPIDAVEVTINLKHDGKGEQFKIAASADRADPVGKSSRFVSSDRELAGDLDREGAEPELIITVNGKQFRGKVEHAH